MLPCTTRAWVRGPAGSTTSPWQLASRSEGLRRRPPILGYTRLVQRARGVDQLCLETRPVNEGPWCRPDLPSDPDPVPRARGVDQLSWAYGASVRGPAYSTTCPGRLGPGSECPWGRPAIPSVSRPCSSACGVDQLSQENRARVGGPAVLTSSPGRIEPVLECLRDQPGFLVDSRSCPRVCGVDHISRPLGSAPRPEGSTRYPGELRSGFEFPRGRPAVLDDSYPG